MVTISTSSILIEVSKVSKQTIRRHDIYVLKHCTQINLDNQFCCGPLQKPPLRQPSIPSYVVKSGLVDTNDAFQQVLRDKLGEGKINMNGSLLGGRQFLFTTFRITSKSVNNYVLVKDLMRTINFEKSQDDFLQQYDQLYFIKPTEDEIEGMLQKGILTNDEESNARYVTTLSAFIAFGASVIVMGCRVIDDYWEQILKEQGFTIHHRVFSLSEFQLKLLHQLRPKSYPKKATGSVSGEDWLHQWESPYSIIQEQHSVEIRQEYAKEHSTGEHIKLIVPGQSINDALELTTTYKLPKYHYKNSFLNAAQQHTEDIPIGKHRPFETVPSAPVGRPSKRIDDFKSQITDRDHSLNINGWKFESLPLAHKNSSRGHTSSGLSYYEKDRLLQRLRRLTPNQVRELEHFHDSLNINTVLGRARHIRRIKWTKYWQYKAGAPIGLTSDQLSIFENNYLPAILSKINTKRVYDEERNVDIIYSTSRVPNPNFLNHSNIKGFRPPYA